MFQRILCPQRQKKNHPDKSGAALPRFLPIFDAGLDGPVDLSYNKKHLMSPDRLLSRLHILLKRPSQGNQPKRGVTCQKIYRCESLRISTAISPPHRMGSGTVTGTAAVPSASILSAGISICGKTADTGIDYYREKKGTRKGSFFRIPLRQFSFCS